MPRWRVLSPAGVNAGISKALTDEPSESFEGHDGVQTAGIEEKSGMANIQHGSFFHEGRDDCHWSDG
jgi:hypothetical protein